MKRCDPKARAKCPDGKQCELYAEFADGSECDKFNEKVLSQPMTNADRIRVMSNEHLANYLIQFTDLDCRIGFCQNKPKCEALLETEDGIPLSMCEKCLLEWLQQPAEEV